MKIYFIGFFYFFGVAVRNFKLRCGFSDICLRQSLLGWYRGQCPLIVLREGGLWAVPGETWGVQEFDLGQCVLACLCIRSWKNYITNIPFIEHFEEIVLKIYNTFCCFNSFPCVILGRSSCFYFYNSYFICLGNCDYFNQKYLMHVYCKTVVRQQIFT